MTPNELLTLAGAQQVAWRTFDGEGNYDYRAYELNEDYADEWNRRNPNHVGWVEPLYTHPAPAAPQAEPIADSDADYWLRNRRPILDAIERAGFMLMSNASGFWLHPRGATDAQAEPNREDQPLRDLLAVIHCDGGHHTEAVGIEQSIKDALTAVCVLKGKLAQAEPKREPLSDEQIDELGDPFGYFQYGDAQGDKRRAFARAVERAAYERAAQECLATAAELRRCADGCTDGRYDWKADGAADCADAISALGRQL